MVSTGILLDSKRMLLYNYNSVPCILLGVASVYLRVSLVVSVSVSVCVSVCGSVYQQ